MSSTVIAQEKSDSLQVQAADSSALRAGSEVSASDYDFFSDSFRMIYAIIFLIIAFILSIYLRQPLQRLSERRSRYSRILKQIVPLLLSISWFLVAYFIITQILDLTYSSTITLFVILGLSLVLSFQDVLKDIVAGMIIPFENHIEVGNKVQINNIFGEVYKTGLRETQIKNSDGNIVVIPNRSILKDTITSVSADLENCPVSVDFYLPYSSDLDNCREIAHKSAIVSPYIFLDKPVTIHFSNELSNGQVFIKMHVIAYLRKIEFQSSFISELTETVLKEISHKSDLPDFR
jgi:small-conductance mechanosensitive channel